MTPAKLDHLRAIDAHLARLLDIAARRTPGEWKAHVNNKRAITVGPINGPTVLSGQYFDIEDEDCAFIASCSNNAEAGWKATRAAIEWLTAGPVFSNEVLDMLESILSAFPLELVAP